jgi:heat shock protein HtpX
MKIWIKRLAMFALVNVLVMVTISFIFAFFGVGSVRGDGTSIPLGPIMLMSVIIGFAGSIISLLLSRIMAKWTMGVKVVDPLTATGDEKALVEMIHRFAKTAELPKMPEVGIYESPEMNAFATGPTKSRSLVAVSSGLLRQMNRSEVEGVVAHEVAHIANGDMVTMTLIQGVVNTFVVAISWVISIAVTNALRSNDREGGGSNPWIRHGVRILCEIVLGIFGVIAVNAFSRWREFRADAGGARLGGKEKMIAALKALQARFEPLDNRGDAIATFKISGGTGKMMGLFMTHPPLQKRIEALEASRVKSDLEYVKVRQDRSL